MQERQNDNLTTNGNNTIEVVDANQRANLASIDVISLTPSPNLFVLVFDAERGESVKEKGRRSIKRKYYLG